MSEPMSMIVTIVERGKGAAMMKLYNKNQVFLHCQRPGRGTATSEIMDILGLGSSEKDILFSYATRSAATRLLDQLNGDLRRAVATSGIVFDIPLTAVNNLVAAAITYKTTNGKKGEEIVEVENKVKNSLIMVTCSRGCTEAVMDTAKKAGARGGTVFKARWSGGEELEQAYDLELNPEREIVAIVVPNEIRNQVMEAITREHGLKSDSQSMICSVPIDQMVRL